MNSISWFIYFSDVVGNLQPTLAISGTVAIIVAGVILLIGGIEGWTGGPKVAKRIAFIAAPAIFISCLIPSKTTMYAIAASQLGEVALSSPDAKEMIDDTKQILRDYLKSLKKDGGKS